MKKLLSILLLSTALIISSLAVPAAVSASPSKGFDSVDYVNEKITGLKTGDQYSVNGKSWVTVYGDELDISTLIKNNGGKVWIRDEIDALANPPIVPDYIVLEERPKIDQKKTSANRVAFNGLGNYNGKTEVGVLTNMTGKEYRVGASEWIPAETDEEGDMDVTAFRNTGAALKVRIKGTQKLPAGVAINIKIPKKPLTPKSVKYNIKTDTFTGVSAKMEYTLVSGSAATLSVPSYTFTKITNPAKGKKKTLDRNDIGLANDGGENTLGVRLQATPKKFASDPVFLDIMPKNTNTPSSEALKLNLVAEQIEGLTTDMEYRIKAGTAPTKKKPTPTDGVIAATQKWVAYKNPKKGTAGTLALTSNLKVDASGQFEVRYKAVPTGEKKNNPSTSLLITLPPRQTIPTDDANAPKIDFENEKIKNVNESYAYIAGTGTDWKIPDPATTLSEGGLNLVAIDALSDVAAEKQKTKTTPVKLRIAPTANKAASLTKTFNIPKRPAISQAKYNPQLDVITNISNAQAYIKNNEALQRFQLTGTVKQIGRDKLGDEAATIKVFVMAKANAFRSPDKTITWPAIRTDTDGKLLPVEFSYETLSITGLIPNEMEYAIASPDAARPGWVTVTNINKDGKFIITPIQNGQKTMLVRLKYTTNPPAPASKAKIITLPTASKKPVLEVNLKNEGIGPVDTTMEYKQDAFDWRKISQANLTGGALNLMDLSHINYTDEGIQLLIRVATVSGSSIASAYVEYYVARQEVPSANNVKFNENDDRITGVSSAMQYSLDNGETWTTIAGSATTIPRSALGEGTASVLVRAKPTTSVKGGVTYVRWASAAIKIDTVVKEEEKAGDMVADEPALIQEEPTADIVPEETPVEETPMEETAEEMTGGPEDSITVAPAAESAFEDAASPVETTIEEAETPLVIEEDEAAIA